MRHQVNLTLEGNNLPYKSPPFKKLHPKKITTLFPLTFHGSSTRNLKRKMFPTLEFNKSSRKDSSKWKANQDPFQR